MRVAVSFDHRGVRLREAVMAAIAAEGHLEVDLGVATDAELAEAAAAGVPVIRTLHELPGILP